MKPAFILVDYENVQPKAMSLLDQSNAKVLIFIGASQTKVNFDVVQAVHSMGDRAEYIKIAGNGPNALDFHISCYIGRLAERHPDASFRIVSRDKGYDALVEHLRNDSISVCRAHDVIDMPDDMIEDDMVINEVVGTSLVITSDGIPTSLDLNEKVDIVINNLQTRKESKPRKAKSLFNVICALFYNKISELDAQALINELIDRGVLSIEDGDVFYAK